MRLLAAGPTPGEDLRGRGAGGDGEARPVVPHVAELSGQAVLLLVVAPRELAETLDHLAGVADQGEAAVPQGPVARSARPDVARAHRPLRELFERDRVRAGRRPARRATGPPPRDVRAAPRQEDRRRDAGDA